MNKLSNLFFKKLIMIWQWQIDILLLFSIKKSKILKLWIQLHDGKYNLQLQSSAVHNKGAHVNI